MLGDPLSVAVDAVGRPCSIHCPCGSPRAANTRDGTIMHESLWSAQRFREFLTLLRGRTFGPPIEDEERDEFLRQARVRIVPDVQRRVLAEVGSTVDGDGVAVVAFELLEDCTSDSRRTWLLASSDPWRYLADLVAREVTAAYGEAVRRIGDDDELAGILSASTRPQLEAGAEE
ncbi:hypothetical protein [Microbacterium sp. ProA8]|uniref:hypothetical protein n=1 Tax=Microbacterium chionoecetis TaxID=3153754 RepID=UPI00326587D9